MSALLRVHRVFIAMAIGLCLAYGGWELARDGSSASRRIAGAGIPAAIAVALGAYLVRMRAARS